MPKRTKRQIHFELAADIVARIDRQVAKQNLSAIEKKGSLPEKLTRTGWIVQALCAQLIAQEKP